MNERVIKGSRKKCKHEGKEGNQREEGGRERRNGDWGRGEKGREKVGG
jgi:hypothetical protein